MLVGDVSVSYVESLGSRELLVASIPSADKVIVA
jgi:hypothetical protein